MFKIEKLLKYTVVSLVFAVIITSFSSCAVKINRFDYETREETSEQETEAQTESEKPDYSIVENDFSSVVQKHLKSIDSEDYGGAVFMIATPKESLISADEASYSMSENLKIRDSYIESKFNVTVKTKNVDADTMYAELYNSCLAGDYYADLLMIPQYRIPEFIAGGLLYNLCGLPKIDFEKGYNMTTGVQSAIAGNVGYGIAGYATLDPDLIPAVFYNKELAEKTGLGDINGLVENGQWTWDKFFEYTDAVSSVNDALAGEGKNSVYTWETQNSSIDMADIVFFSEGNRFISAGVGNSPAVAYTYDGTLKTAEDSQRLISDAGRNTSSMAAIDDFANGGALFLIDRLGTMKDLAASSAVWGVLPMPKGSEEQENYAGISSSDSLFFSVPVNCANVAETSNVLSALNAASMGYLIDGYVKDSMYYYLRDNDSVVNVERICYSAVFDMAYTFGEENNQISYATYFGARWVSEGSNDFGFYLDNYSWSANNILSGYFY